MSNLLACRVCLATDDVKLYNLNTLNLMHSYEILTGVQILLEDQLPQHICTFCSALLIKSVNFKEKCCNSQEILKFTSQQGRLTLNAIRDINQPHRHPYSTAHEHRTITIDTTIIKQEIKEEEERVQKKSKRKKKIEKVVVKVEDEVNHDHDYVNYESDSEIEPVLEIRGLELQNIEIPDTQIQDRELKDVEIVILSKAEQKQEIEKRKTSSNYLNSYYKCDQCYKGFITEPTFRNHMTCHDPERGPHACDVCRSHWACARALRAHALNTHERKYMCKVCDHVSRSSHRAKEHSKWHSGFSFICKTCGASFAKSTSYLTHTRLQHPSSNSCELCGESFVGEFGLRMHKKKTHVSVTHRRVHHTLLGCGRPHKYPLGSAQCDQCEVKFDSREALVRHLELAGDDSCDTMRPCTHCGEGFDSEESLREHEKTHEKDDVSCEECKLTFSSARSYATHYQRVHLGLKLKQHKPRSYKKPVDSHVCEMCGKKCITKATLMYHQRIHTGERPFHCTECPKKFSVYQRLQNHRRGHSGERPHRCRECGKAFILNEQLKIHQRIHTGETPYQCKSCPKAFKHKAALNRHDRVHTGAKPYSCPHCGKSFSQSNSMKLHVSTVHLKLPAPYRARRNKI